MGLDQGFDGLVHNSIDMSTMYYEDRNKNDDSNPNTIDIIDNDTANILGKSLGFVFGIGFIIAILANIVY